MTALSGRSWTACWIRQITTSCLNLVPVAGPGECFLGTSPAHVLIYSSNRGVRYRVEDVVLDAQAVARRGTKIGEETLFCLLFSLNSTGGNAARCCQGLATGLRRRLKVVALIWPHMLAIATCYLVTMAVFPGMESEVVSCSLLDWMPILLLSVFHATDLAGKLLAGLGHSWSKGELVLWPLARLCLLPLILLCALPRQKPVFQVT